MAKLILWAILILLAIRAISRLIHGVLDGAGYRLSGGGTPGVALARDPICGVFVVPGQALQLGEGGNVRYFCSEKCRREWTARSRA